MWLDTNGNGKLDDGEPAFATPVQTDASGVIAPQNWPLTDVPAGLFSIQVGVCPDAPVAGLCFGTTGVASAQLTITLGVSHSEIGAGTTLAITGYGFSPSGSVNVWYDDNPNGELGGASGSTSPNTDSNGAFSASLLIKGNPGDHFVHAGPSTVPQASVRIHIGTCWFQDCFINGADNICLLGNSPSDLQFLGVGFADCKAVDSNYTDPTPVTLANNPPGGYDFNNVGPVFMGAEVLAAATNDLGLPGTGCVAMNLAIGKAEALGNFVPGEATLLVWACVPPVLPLPPFTPNVLVTYVAGHEACVLGIGPCQHVPDRDFIEGAVGGIDAAFLAAGGPLNPVAVTALALAQTTMAEAAVAGAIACGSADYFCKGSDITLTILENPDLQRHEVPVTFLQPPFHNPASPNPCAAAGVNGTCWGDIIGWSKVTCQVLVSASGLDTDGNGDCEHADMNDPTKFSQLAIPGTAGAPHNSGVDPQCASGTVLGLSIGYDGDVSFDISGPEIFKNGPNQTSLVNYHNFLPGPGGSEPPNGLDIEIPLTDRAPFLDVLTALRPGMKVHVCGRWVADMHMKWNELHPVTSLSIVVPLTVTAKNATQVYGAATPAFDVSYSGFVNGDAPAVLGGTLTCVTTATSASPVGNYPINCSGQTSSTYDIVYVPGTLAITPAPLTIVANNATRSYGAPNPSFTTSPSGLVNGDTLVSIGLNPTCGTTATSASSVGSYPITCSGPTSTTNYSISYQTGTLAITPAPLTIVANNATRSYGALNPAFTTSASGLVNGDTLVSIGLNPTCGTTATSASSVGSYPITCSGPSSTTNYSISYQTGTLMISAAALTITAKDASKLLNAPNPAFSATYSGLVNGDSPASLTGSLTCSTPATTTSPVGSYAITCSGQSSTNYKITYVPGTLKILYASSGICDGEAGHQILQPINVDGTSVWKQGRTVPAKFRVCDANGVSVGTPGVVKSFMLVQIVSGTVTNTDQTVFSTTPDTAFRWDPSAQQWIFNINTGSLPAGQTYVYAIALNDGSTIMFQYGLR